MPPLRYSNESVLRQRSRLPSSGAPDRWSLSPRLSRSRLRPAPRHLVHGWLRLQRL
jgi:hypothetical protein